MLSSACPKCGAENSEKSIECARCGIVFQKYFEAEELRKIMSTSRVNFDPSEESDELTPFEEFNQNKWVKLLFLPGCFLFAILFHQVLFLRMIVFGFSHWFHELGHAAFAWVSGRAALPILGLAITSENKTVFTYLCLLFLIFFMGFSGIRYKSPYLLFVAILFLIAQSFYTFVASDSFWQMSMIYGGIGGEFILSSLVIAAFCYRFPAQSHWDLLRFVVVPLSMISLWQSTSLWVKIFKGDEMLPAGSLWGGPEDSNGDINRLVNDFDFSRADLTRAYLTTAAICWAFIALSYLWFALSPFLRHSFGKGNSRRSTYRQQQQT